MIKEQQLREMQCSLLNRNGVKTSLSLSDPFVVEVFSENIKTIIGDDGLDLIFCNGDEARSFHRNSHNRGSSRGV